MTATRVLVVEDNQDNVDLLVLWLGEKYGVFAYTCAEEALTAIGTVKPDVLLLDIGLGPIDGVACLAAIRAMPGYSSIPAIALTGYARDSEREVFQAAGFQAVLAKPILEDDLFAAILRVLPQAADPGAAQSSVTTAA